MYIYIFSIWVLVPFWFDCL